MTIPFTLYCHFSLPPTPQNEDRVGVVRRPNGDLHFFFNGVDKGVAASHVASSLYGVVDLYGQAAKVTIVDPAGEAFFG